MDGSDARVADGFSAPVPNGLFADTGQPWPGLEAEDLEALVEREREPPLEERLSQIRADPGQASFGAIGDVDVKDLSQAGWGVIFAAGADPKVKEALRPLLDHRGQQTGDQLFKVFDGADGYRPQDTAPSWLARRNVSMAVVDPYLGVPFYLLVVGSPEEIPFEFQYTLDIFWGVGRLYFEELAGYRRYAESVVAYETAASVPHARQVALFATRNDYDQATQLFAGQVAEPLTRDTGPWGRLGRRQKFGLQAFVGDPATKETLATVFRGQTANGPPALLLTGSHGMVFHDPQDPRLPESQGALICQDWDGVSALAAEHWFAAADLPADARVHGLIHFFFACFGAGWPQHDTFRRPDPEPKQIAPRPMLARLPQALLAHEQGGALATLGHVDRAWSYSFQSARGGPQLQGFRDVMGRLLRGERLGQATDQFNVRWAALSTELADALNDRAFGAPISDQELGNRWVARDDARNYVILGDPAVRLRVEDMPEVG